MSCFIANAQWSNNPAENNLISPVTADTYNFEVGRTNDGNVFVTYIRPMGGSSASILQIIDTKGIMPFSDEGINVSQRETWTWTLVGGLLLIDNDGNAIIAVTDCRNSFDRKISYSLYKVSPTGELLWGEDGVDVSKGLAFDYIACMSMIQLEDGSYMCAWVNMEAGPPLTSEIQMQRISSTGELLWSDKEMPQFNYADTYLPQLVNAGNNQAVLIFTRGSGRQLMARKIDFDGSSVWSEDLYIYRGGFTIPPIQVAIKVIPDQMGGAFVGWYDDRNFINKESTYIAHIKSNGQHGFASAEGGERIGYNDYLRSFAPAMYFDKENNALYVAYRETNSGQSWQQMTCQKMSIPSGELLWELEGKEIYPLATQSVSQYSIQEDGKGNIAIFFSYDKLDEPEITRAVHCVALINSNGEYVWKDEIIQFANCEGIKGNMASTKLINNTYWVAVWKDERRLEGETEARSKIYMQRINIDGTLGEIESATEKISISKSFSIIPSIITEYADIYVKTIKSGKGEINLYSITGQKIETIYKGQFYEGLNTITWNVQKNKLSKGVYIVTLKTKTEYNSLRIIIN